MKLDQYGALDVGTGVVKPEWIDINGHMNVAYYVLAFDLAIDSLWSRIGITPDYIESTGGSTFAVESHVTYQHEIKEGEAYRISAALIAYDEKRVHQVQRMYHAEQNFLAATAEWMNLHVDLRTRRVSRWPPQVMESFADLARIQGNPPMPAEVGKRMRINKPIYSLQTSKEAES